jgi:hypothetical protein
MVEAAGGESQRLGLRNVEHRELGGESMDLEDDQELRGRIEEAVEPYRSDDGYELPGLAQNKLAT